MYKLAVQRQGSKALLDNYRPITLLNSDYKLLYECLATRFGPALQHVVDPTQTAFVPGRWIFFYFFYFFWEGEIFITRSNDNNLKET